MRPIITEQNPVRYRLNELLGTEAHVRILRVLSNEADGPLTVSDIAGRAGLTSRGARKALKKLIQTGVVHRVGGGRKYQVELRRSDKLASVVQDLFRAERAQYDELLSAIRDGFERLVPYPRSAWIQEFPGDSGGPLILGVLHETRYLADYTYRLRTQLIPVEQGFDLTIEVNGYTKADLPAFVAEPVVLLHGALPFPDGDDRGFTAEPLTHEERDRRLLELSRRIAEAIEHDSSLVRRAREHVDRMLQQDQGHAARDIREWRDILGSYSIRRLSRFLASTGERANRLRQSNPIFAILTSDERNRFLSELGEEEPGDARTT